MVRDIQSHLETDGKCGPPVVMKQLSADSDPRLAPNQVRNWGAGT